MTTGPDFEAWTERARATDLVAEVERRGITLTRGTERTGPCPIEGAGRDRFSINLRKRIWHCRGCDTGGDIIKLVMMADGVDFVRACEILTGEPPPRGRELSPEERAAIAARHAERDRLAAEKRDADEKASRQFREDERRRLYAIWRSAANALRNTPVEAYLARRGIAMVPANAALRFLPLADYYYGTEPDPRRPGKTRPKIIHRGPAMLAAITGADGRFRGLHFTFLHEGARGWDKFSPGLDDKGEALPAKKVRGSQLGGRIVLLLPQHVERVIAGEGNETTLSAWYAAAATGRLRVTDAYLAGISLGNLAGKALDKARIPGEGRTRFVPGPTPDLDSPAMPLPEGTRDVVLLGDGDSEPTFTQNAMIRAAARARALTPTLETARIAWADEGGDFNDMLGGTDD